MILDALSTSLWIASWATLLSGGPALLLAWVLARKTFPGKALVSGIVGLPLVLPPTAIGFLLLAALASSSPLGSLLEDWGVQLLFTPAAAVIAVAVVIFPLIVRTARVAFEQSDPLLERWVETFGFSRNRVIWKVVARRARRGILAALSLGFTRALGEFGASVIVAGMIPGKTLSLASGIYLSRELGDTETGAYLTWIALILGLAAVMLTEWLSTKRRIHAAR